MGIKVGNLSDLMRALSEHGVEDPDRDEEMERRSIGEDDPRIKGNPPDDAAALALMENCAIYQKGNSFKVGDLITPRVGMNIRGTGKPCVVLKVFDTPIADQPTSSNEVMGSFDILIGRYFRGNMMTYGGEAWRYEPYTGPVLTAN